MMTASTLNMGTVHWDRVNQLLGELLELRGKPGKTITRAAPDNRSLTEEEVAGEMRAYQADLLRTHPRVNAFASFDAYCRSLPLLVQPERTDQTDPFHYPTLVDPRSSPLGLCAALKISVPSLKLRRELQQMNILEPPYWKFCCKGPEYWATEVYSQMDLLEQPLLSLVETLFFQSCYQHCLQGRKVVCRRSNNDPRLLFLNGKTMEEGPGSGRVERFLCPTGIRVNS